MITNHEIAVRLIERNTNLDTGQPEIIFVPGKGWYYWNEDRWTADQTGVLTRLTIDTMASFPEPPPANLVPIRHAIGLAQDMPNVTVPAEHLDTSPYLLNTPNGYVDLRDSSHHRPDPAALLTHITSVPYVPNAEAPRFRQFLQEILPDDEMRAFLQRALGYTTTGLVSEEVLFLLVGKGANGKTTLTSIIRRILGTYARPVSTSLLTAKFTGGHETEKLALQGIRYAIANETDFGQSVAEARIKALVSTEAITARGAYQKEAATFNPTHHLWLSTNYLPNIDGSDDGLARRLIVIEFPRTFSRDERNNSLAADLLQESSGILNYLIEGARLYLESGLQIPESVQEEVDEYRSDMDVLGRFIEEYLDFGAEYSTTNAELWDAFSAFQSTEPHGSRLGRRSFSQAMKRRFKQINSNGQRKWPGMRVRQSSISDLISRAGL